MRYVEGEPLDRLLGRVGTLDEEDILKVFHPLLDGLEQVHAVGFLHRDADKFVFTSLEKQIVGFETVSVRGSTMRVPIYGSVTDTVTDFDTSGVDHVFIDIASILVNDTDFYSTGKSSIAAQQRAIDQGYVYFVQSGTPGQADFGTTVWIDVNGGGHGDAANNYAVAFLQGIPAAELRPDLFFV